MLIVLPPSETKVSGGQGSQVLDLERLSFPCQNPVRASLVAELQELAGDVEKSRAVLKLGPKGVPEVHRNRELQTSALLPAISRYTGVLYDQLGYSTLDTDSATHLNAHVAIHSALFGLIRSTDPIPAYRLSYDSALAAGRPVARWAPSRDALWREVSDFVIDLRSEGYRSLSPLAEGSGVFVNLVSPGPVGERKALGHANKGTKGRLVRDMMNRGAVINSVAQLVEFGEQAGYFFDPQSHREGRIDLVISGS
jgi:uncharacterized protein